MTAESPLPPSLESLRKQAKKPREVAAGAADAIARTVQRRNSTCR